MNYIQAVQQYTDDKDWARAANTDTSRYESMFRAITDDRKKIGRALTIYLTNRIKRAFGFPLFSSYYSELDTLKELTNNSLPSQVYEDLAAITDIELLRFVVDFLETNYNNDPHISFMLQALRNKLRKVTTTTSEEGKDSKTTETKPEEKKLKRPYNGFFKPVTDEDLNEEVDLEETYSDEELDKMIGKVYNLQKIEHITRREKYGAKRLFASTVCTKCGRKKKVFLSNLVNDPEKYGSCICSDVNINSRIDNASDLYTNKKRLKTNTSGYTGVTFVKNYGNAPYNKWRAYIEVDGVRTYLGDFDTKKEAIKARREAGEKGIKWYKDNRSKLVKNVRKRTKKYQTSKYRDVLGKTEVEIKDKD